MKLKKIYYDFILKNYKIKGFNDIMKKIAKAHKEATGKKLSEEEKTKLARRIRITMYFSKEISKMLAFIYNNYGMEEAMGVMTSTVADYVHHAIKPQGRDSFFKYLKGSIDGATALELKNLLTGEDDEKHKSKMRYIG